MYKALVLMNTEDFWNKYQLWVKTTDWVEAYLEALMHYEVNSTPETAKTIDRILKEALKSDTPQETFEEKILDSFGYELTIYYIPTV